MGFSKIQEEFRQNIWRRSRSEGMLAHVDVSFTMFERFCQDSYKKRSSRVIAKIKLDIQKAYREGTGNKKLYLFLDNFVQWLSEYTPKKKANLSPITIRSYLSEIIQFLRYNEILIDNDLLKHFVSLPKKLKELPQPITRDEINILVTNADEKRSALYLTLVSSGIRIGESLQLRKRNFEMKPDPAKIFLPAQITKTKEPDMVCWNCDKLINHEKVKWKKRTFTAKSLARNPEQLKASINLAKAIGEKPNAEILSSPNQIFGLQEYEYRGKCPECKSELACFWRGENSFNEIQGVIAVPKPKPFFCNKCEQIINREFQVWYGGPRQNNDGEITEYLVTMCMKCNTEQVYPFEYNLDSGIIE